MIFSGAAARMTHRRISGALLHGARLIRYDPVRLTIGQFSIHRIKGLQRSTTSAKTYLDGARCFDDTCGNIHQFLHHGSDPSPLRLAPLG